MSNWLMLEPTRHQVAIAGQVTDAQTDTALARAEVQIAGQAECVQTVADGHFHFLDLPDGVYTLTVSLPGSGSRYGAAQAEVTVARDGQGNIILAAADVALPPTTLRGQITDQTSGDPIVMAQAGLAGSRERTYSDGEGRYLLAGLEAGQRTLMVSARDFEPSSQTVQLSRGEVLQVDIALQRV